MNPRRAGLVTLAMALGIGVAFPAFASACTETPVLSQACQAGQAGVDVGDAAKENLLDGPLPGATNDAPITGAIGSAAKNAIGTVTEPIFDQIASASTETAIWLIGKITDLIDTTTSPDLMSRGFVEQYAQMAGIAAFLAAAMLLLAVVDGLVRADIGMLGRVVGINLPLAFVATSSAYVVVQLLLGVTDQMSHAVAHSTGPNTEHFLHGATEGLSKAGAGATQGPGATAVPVFAVIIAALVAIVAGFFLWIELAMRDAAVYVVALFLPLALAASIWPRWSGALRRTAELLIAVIASKFVIVSIIALAAGLLAQNGGRFEHVIAAAALLLLACFAPLVLIKLVPFAEGAMVAAHGRRSGAGMALGGLQLASSAQMMLSTSRANWSSGQGHAMQRTSGGGHATAAGAQGGAAVEGPGPFAAAGAPVQGSRAAAAYLASTAIADSAGEGEGVSPSGSGAESLPRPSQEKPAGQGGKAASPPPDNRPSRPPSAGDQGEGGNDA